MAWLFKGSSGGAGLSLHDVKEPVFKKEPVDSGLASASFSLFAGARRADGEGVSVFRLERSKGDEGSTKVQSALKCVKLAKTLRHPHVLPFHEGEASEAGGGEVSVVTDEVLPLEEWLKVNGGGDPRTLAWGAYCALQALGFLHQSGRAHGGVSPDAFFVTNGGDWKLWGFELSCKVVPGSGDDDALGFFRAHEHLVDARYRSPERRSRDWELIAGGKTGAVDVYGLARVLEDAYGDRVPRELAVWIRRMVDDDPLKRPSADQVLRGCPLFRQPLMKEMQALQDLQASSLEDQVGFYRRLDAATSRLTPDGLPCKGALDEALWRGACVHKLLPRLLATLDIALAGSSEPDAAAKRRAVVSCALPLLVQIVDMLKVGGEAPPPADGAAKYAAAAEQRVVAKIVTALETVLVIRDPAVRLEALKRADALAPLLSADYVNRKLFDALLLGFGDANDDARLLTLMAMLAIAPRLNEKNRTDRLLRVVKRLEGDKAAKIRTNVIIFYGRLAPELSEQLRHKVVLPAFVKALDDKIPFIRLAAVRALGATRDVFNAQIGARLIAPKLVPLAVDVNGHVRDAAIPCLEAYLSEVRKEAERMTKEDAAREQRAAEKRVAEVEAAKHAPPPPAAAAAPAAAEAAAPAAPADDGGGWASWAVGKVGAGLGAGAAAVGKGVATAATAAVAAAAPTPAPAAPAQPPAPPAPEPAAPAADGWGDDDDAAGSPKAAGDGWGGDGWGDEPAAPPPPKKASPRSAPKRASPRAAPKPASDGWGDDWGDDAPVKTAAVSLGKPKAGGSAEDKKRAHAARKAELEKKRQARAAARGAGAAAAAAPPPAPPPAAAAPPPAAPAASSGVISLKKGTTGKLSLEERKKAALERKQKMAAEKEAKKANMFGPKPVASKLPNDDSMWDDF